MRARPRSTAEPVGTVAIDNLLTDFIRNRSGSSCNSEEMVDVQSSTVTIEEAVLAESRLLVHRVQRERHDGRDQ